MGSKMRDGAVKPDFRLAPGSIPRVILAPPALQ